MTMRSPSSVMSSIASGSCTNTTGAPAAGIIEASNSSWTSCAGAEWRRSSASWVDGSLATEASAVPRWAAARGKRFCQSRASMKTCSISSAEKWNSAPASASPGSAAAPGSERPGASNAAIDEPSIEDEFRGSASSGTVSVSRCRASNALPQRPQRTVPCAARSAPAVTRNRVRHSGHWEYIARSLPARRRRPVTHAAGP